MTKIEWCDESWNPVIGCSKISEGCLNCYAERMATRQRHMEKNRHGDKRHYTKVCAPNFSGGGWNGNIHFIPERLEQPLKWKKPRRIFVCSMGDLFHPGVSSHSMNEIIKVIFNAKHHIFIVLTKRPERMKAYFERYYEFFKLIPNLLLGVTAENQQTADERIPILLQIPASVRFVSVEPMLERVNPFSGKYIDINNPQWVDWVIAGPETGPKARPCPKGAIGILYDQTKEAGIPFFDKRKNYLAREFPKGV